MARPIGSAERLKSMDLEEGKDFIPFLKESTGGRPEKNYIVTLENADYINADIEVPIGSAEQLVLLMRKRGGYYQ